VSGTQRRRGISGRNGPGPARPRRAGEPNVLSDAATPNVLSTPAARPLAPAVNRSASPGTGSPAVVSPANQGWLATGQPAPAPRVRLPSFGTLIFLGFLAITAIRVIGEVASGITEPTTAPAPTAPAAPGGGAAPGPISFGGKQGSDCGVAAVSVEFGPEVDVWWSAELATVQPADAAAVVIVLRNGTEVDREEVPADPSFGEWSVLCAVEPITLHDPGTYRVEVWNEDVTVLHAAGEYRIRGS
jgi:hypothetical protein